MVQVNISIYKVVNKYNFNGEERKLETYFVDLEKALKWAADTKKGDICGAIHEMRENEEDGYLESAKCIEIW